MSSSDKPALTRSAAWLGGDIDEALHEVRVPAFLLDRDGLVTWQNAQSTSLFGARGGRHFTEIVAPDVLASARLQFAKSVLGTTRTIDFGSVLLGRSGERIPVKIHSVAVEGGGRVVGVFGIVDLAETRLDLGSSPSVLTPRQFEVLHALAQGYSTAQIADASHLSRTTVRNHIQAVLRALGVHSQLAAVAEGRRRGLID